ncbi:uncharacterized protein LOC108673899 [Hyalella azteca]|uniref:Uncharacterized protein LOC108673899 n=1 Tax=Hyalella azteca TaxID=294128 RepID=A0A8B7NU87_HYAAZ|nr:uncharacterized protein LOC108673899 [Hyalella azteca]
MTMRFSDNYPRWVVILPVLIVLTTLALAADSSLWRRMVANPDGAAVTGRLDFSSDSVIACAAQAAQRGSDLLCHDGVMACVIVLTTSLVGVLGVTNHSWNCFLRGPWCRPPFMQVRDLGCLQFDINNLMNFSDARTACPPPATLWYPKSNEQAATIADYLTNERYAAPAGGVCGPSVPLPDGYPGPCRPKGTATCCNATGVCGGTIADCTCPTCINYENVARAFWTGFQKKAGVWTYDDNRTVMDTRGVAPWGPNDPTNKYDCAAIYIYPLFNYNYQYMVVHCTVSTYASICRWPEML